MTEVPSPTKETDRDHSSDAVGRVADAPSNSVASDAHMLLFNPWTLTSLSTELVGSDKVPAHLAISNSEWLALMQARLVLRRLAAIKVPSLIVTAQSASEDIRRILAMFGTWICFDE